jgi:hypothetical protein
MAGELPAGPWGFYVGALNNEIYRRTYRKDGSVKDVKMVLKLFDV